ncbi:hypothetical protein Taro_042387 [Colocasia esculenta]|uniref:Uncharacterized protein n=1 Tax=Colocasia esculenta TaxID=4460 RepID=A0A843WDU5_COLES|nr:hypothetical protein [Colocasia esculenta]
MRIFICLGVGTAREAKIQNRHFDPRLPRLRESLAKPTRGAAQSQRSEVMFNLTRDLLPRIGTPRCSTASWFCGIPFRGQNSPPERVY